MSYICSLSPLYTYIRKERLNQKELADKLGINVASLSRYLCGKRLPDVDTLVEFCNRLHVSVGTFIYPKDITDMDVTPLDDETFTPIQVNRNGIVDYSIKVKKDQRTIAQEISKAVGKRITESTLVRFKNGHVVRMEPILAFLNAYTLPLTALFDDNSIFVTQKANIENENNIRTLQNQIKYLKNDNIRLRTKISQYQKGTRKAECDTHIVAEPSLEYGLSPSRDLRIRRCIARLQSALKDLEYALDAPMDGGDTE
jgi:DNA-binding Xre family transcriptional regulator